MKSSAYVVRWALAAAVLASSLAVGTIQSPAAVGGSLPAVVQSGLSLLMKNGPELAVDAWRRGGLMESDNKPEAVVAYFRRLDSALGNYLSFELIDSKSVGQSSQIMYLALRFQRGAVYGRFHLYRTEKDWVVQNMDFNTRPEAIMPYLAFEAASGG